MKCGDGGGKLMSNVRAIWSVEERLGLLGDTRRKREKPPSDVT